MLFNLLKTPLGRLRLVGFAEGVSYLVLLGVAVPLKYLAGVPTATRLVGSLHGALFVAYTLLLIQTAIGRSWSFSLIGRSFLASLVPFGTFYADRKIFGPAAQVQP